MFGYKLNKGMFWVDLNEEKNPDVRAQMLDKWLYDPAKYSEEKDVRELVKEQSESEMN